MLPSSWFQSAPVPKDKRYDRRRRVLPRLSAFQSAPVPKDKRYVDGEVKMLEVEVSIRSRP